MITVASELAKAPTGEAAKSGPWGFAIILLLAVASYFLFRSMSKHMRRVREDFPTGRADAERTDPVADQKDPAEDDTAGQRTTGVGKGDQPPGEGEGEVSPDA